MTGSRIKKVPYPEVAAELGLSVRTVYRVLNAESRVRDTTRKKIIDALHERGVFLENVRRSRIVFDLRPAQYLQTQFDVLRQRLPEDEFEMTVIWHEDDQRRFRRLAEEADYVVYFASPPCSLIEQVRDINPDIQQINLYGDQGGNIQINPDDRACGALAAGYLYSRGHRRVAVFSSIGEQAKLQRNRCEAFLGIAAVEYPAMSVEKHVCRDYSEFRAGVDSCLDRIDELDALFLTCGWEAYQVYDLAKARGIKVPEDISILTVDEPETVGIQGIDVLDYIDIHPERIANWAEYFLRNRPLMKNPGPLNLLVGVDLCPRGSVRCL